MDSQTHASTSPSSETKVADPVKVSHWLLKRFYTHNPFYLLSVACVLHGSSYWMQSAGVTRSWPLIGLIAGYIVILSVVAWAIVRLGKVWDDARSILLLIPLLFVEFSLSFDDPLLTNPFWGVLLVIAGYLFAGLITEGLLRGLQIRLPVLLRLPMHGLLALMMLYPLALSPYWQTLSSQMTSWRIYAFFPITGLLLLFLIPGIRRGRRYLRDSGTPWLWPWYPWTIFAVLLAGVLLRGYALTLSFDPVLSLGFEAAMQLQTAWGLYFLAPVLLAVGWLLLEFGFVLNEKKLQRIACAVPLICLGLSIPLSNGSEPYTEFLALLTTNLASPFYLSLMGASVFYGMAILRGAPLADFGLAIVLILFSVVGPETHDWQTTATLNVGPLILACGFLAVRGLTTRRSLPFFLGTLSGIAALWFSLPVEWPRFWQNALAIHLMGCAALGTGLAFRDAFGGYLRRAAAFAFLSGCGFAVFGTPLFPASIPEWILWLYASALTIATFALAYGLRSRLYLIVGMGNLALGSLGGFREIYLALRSLPEWPGIASFGLAFLLLAVGGGISAAKAGLFERLKSLLPRQPLESQADP